jgi:hypothetical protein
MTHTCSERDSSVTMTAHYHIAGTVNHHSLNPNNDDNDDEFLLQNDYNEG